MVFEFSILDEIQADAICFIDVVENSLKIELFAKLLKNGQIPVFFPRDWENEEKLNFYESCEYSAYYVSKNLEFKFNHKINNLKLEGYGSFTSGRKSTGVLYFYDLNNAIKCAMLHFSSLGINSSCKIYNFIGIEHSFGILVHIIAKYYLSYKVKFISSHDSFELDEVDEKEKIALHTTPKGLAFLLEYNTSLLRRVNIVSVGSDFLNRASFEKFKLINECDFFITYGLSEMGPRVTTFKKNSSTIKEDDSFEDSICIGKPLDGIEVKILNSAHVLACSGEGYLAIKSPFAAINVNSKQYRNEYFISEDMVYLAGNGLIHLKREGNYIKHNGIVWTTSEIIMDIKNIPLGSFVVTCREGLREKMFICIKSKYEKLDLNAFFRKSFLENAFVMYYDESYFLKSALHKINSKIISKILKIEPENIVEWTNVFVEKS
jgi:hypothetical protein